MALAPWELVLVLNCGRYRYPDRKDRKPSNGGRHPLWNASRNPGIRPEPVMLVDPDHQGTGIPPVIGEPAGIFRVSE
ncbi:MAG: hypothetical protein RL215_538 [Planctomycetota bacterium]